jgi:tRNA pseudouridine38-40 synthase
MELYQVTLAYDGTDFKGYQRQIDARTVQNEIEQALTKLGWKERSILSAGRTDTGVHAEGQVIAFRLDWQHTSGELSRALNDLLPADISIMSVEIAREGFHPRFDANQRRYRYQIYFGRVVDPLRDRYYWRVWPKPVKELLERAGKLFIGTHDLKRFGKPPDEKTPTIRTINSIEWNWLDKGESVYFNINAKAFLYHMVRRIVHVLIKVGQNRISMQELEESIDNRIDLPAGIAPAKGLFLERIIY